MGNLTSSGSLTATTTTLCTAVGPVMLQSISMSSPADSIILEIHDSATTAGISASNLIATYYYAGATSGIAQVMFDDVMAMSGLVVKATLGASGPACWNLEWE